MGILTKKMFENNYGKEVGVWVKKIFTKDGVVHERETLEHKTVGYEDFIEIVEAEDVQSILITEENIKPTIFKVELTIIE